MNRVHTYFREHVRVRRKLSMSVIGHTLDLISSLLVLQFLANLDGYTIYAVSIISISLPRSVPRLGGVPVPCLPL